MENYKKSKEKKNHGILHEIEGEEDDTIDIQNFNDKTKFTAFNLREENEDGHFDANGNFVWKKEEMIVQEDAWLENITSTDMENTKKAKENKNNTQNENDECFTELTAQKTLFELLQSNETIINALKRLGSKRNETVRAKKKKLVVKETHPNNSIEKKQKENMHKQSPEEMKQFNKITEAADYLMRKGDVDIYQLTQKDLLIKINNNDKNVIESEKLNHNPMYWEYKAALSGDNQIIYGPYSTDQMIAWKNQGYFCGESTVYVRPVYKEDIMDQNKLNQDINNTLSNDFLKDLEDTDQSNDDNNDTINNNDIDNKNILTSEKKTKEWKRSDELDFSKYL